MLGRRGDWCGVEVTTPSSDLCRAGLIAMCTACMFVTKKTIGILPPVHGAVDSM